MHAFRVQVIAGDGHPKFPMGFDSDGIVVVDSRDYDEAWRLASRRLIELGWSGVEVKGAILLPEEPDASTLSPQMRKAISMARDLTVAFVAYPQKAT